MQIFHTCHLFYGIALVLAVGQKVSKPCWFNFLGFQQNEMKVGEMMKQFKLNILILLFR